MRKKDLPNRFLSPCSQLGYNYFRLSKILLQIMQKSIHLEKKRCIKNQ